MQGQKRSASRVLLIVVENPKDKAHPTAASCRPGLNETPGRASPLHSCTCRNDNFGAFPGVFVTPHWRSLFVPIIVKRRLQMIKEFDNYIHLNQASSRRQTLWSIGEWIKATNSAMRLLWKAAAMIRRWCRQSSARWRPREMLRLPKRRMPSERQTILLLRFERRAT
jgi:hypothetical protein